MQEHPGSTSEDQRIIGLFVRQAGAVVACSVSLRCLLHADAPSLQHLEEIQRQERESDGLTREVMTGLRRSRLLRLDQVDVRELVTAADNAIGHMKRAANSVRLFRTDNVSPGMRDMADAICRCAALVQTTASLLEAPSTPDGLADDMNARIAILKQQTGEICDAGIRGLYEARLRSNILPIFIGIRTYYSLDEAAEQMLRAANLALFLLARSPARNSEMHPDQQNDGQ